MRMLSWNLCVVASALTVIACGAAEEFPPRGDRAGDKGSLDDSVGGSSVSSSEGRGGNNSARGGNDDGKDPVGAKGGDGPASSAGAGGRRGTGGGTSVNESGKGGTSEGNGGSTRGGGGRVVGSVGGNTGPAGTGRGGNTNTGVGGAARGGTGGASTGAMGGAISGSAGGTARRGAGGSGQAGGAGGAATTTPEPVGSTGPITVKKFVGNITTGNSVDTGGKVYSKYWDQITPENAGKWGSVQSSAGATYNWSTLDAIYSYCEKNNVLFKQHTFVWGSQQPGGTINEAAVKAWMSAFCKRYPNTKLIDVVNEPPPHTTPAYANSIGGGTNGTWQWIINAFTWAREACPGAILIFNDYNNIEWSGDASHFIDIVKKVKAAGAPIDAVGAQSHDLDHASVTFDTVKKMLADLNTQTGLPVYITELDISTADDTQQLNAYKQFIPLFMDAEYVKGITIWGWIYGQTWSQAPNSGLIRSGTARPAMTWLMQQLGRPAP